MGKRLKSGEKIIPVLDLDQYKGQWLALEPGNYRVVAHASSLSVAEKRAHQKGVKNPAMFPVPHSDHPFVGHGVILSRGDNL